MHSKQHITLTTSQYIPTEAYLYKPQPSDIKAKSSRLLFDGNLKLDDKESKAVQQFRIYASKNHYNLKPYWNNNKILRFLQAAAYNNDKTLTSIKNFTTWRETKLPIKVDQKLQDFLNSGFLYVHGRDHKFRPIVIFNVNQLDLKTFDVEFIITAMTFWFEHIIDEWMLPGQVENWVFITNLKGMGLSTMMAGSVKRLFSYLQENYKCRLHKVYNINATSSIYVPWSIAKKFLDGDTVDKVDFGKTQIPSGLFTHTNKSQVEQKFGGTAPDATQFWPPVVPSNDYFISQSDTKSLMTKEEYVKLYRNDGLKGMKISKDLVEEEGRGSTQATDTTHDHTNGYHDAHNVSIGSVGSTGEFEHEDMNEFGASVLAKLKAQ